MARDLETLREKLWEAFEKVHRKFDNRFSAGATDAIDIGLARAVAGLGGEILKVEQEIEARKPGKGHIQLPKAT